MSDNNQQVATRVYLDEPYWEKLVLDCITKSKKIYRYDGSTSLTPSVVKDKILTPLICYTLFDIKAVLANVDIEDRFVDELEQAIQSGIVRDSTGFISLTDKQVEFAERYKDDVGAWLTLAFKKHVIPKVKNIKGFCYADS